MPFSGTLYTSASQGMYPELVGRVVRCSGPGATVRAEIAASLLKQRFAIFDAIAPVQPAQPLREKPVAKLDNVHSVLRLNYETVRL